MIKDIEVWEIVKDNTVMPLLVIYDDIACEVVETVSIGCLTQVKNMLAVPYIVELKYHNKSGAIINNTATIYKNGDKWFVVAHK